MRVAIMRLPSRAYSVKCGDLGVNEAINLKLALRQHQQLRGIYRRHGYKIELLPPSIKYEASVFVQDVAFVCKDQALLTNCMSPWRTRESRHRGQIYKALNKYINVVGQMGLPAELDVGEVVKTDKEYLVGISKKAAYYGVKQLRKKLDLDLPIRTVKRKRDGMAHLGSGLSYIGDGYLLASEYLEGYKFLDRYKVIWIPMTEENGGNVVRLVDGCLIADAGSPYTVWKLRELGWDVEAVEMSEYNKANGHISCLSINLVT